MYLIDILILVGGLLLLVKGADLFVTSSSWIAKRFGVSEFIIGLTLVSIGTSVPELASSLTASFEQASGIVIGNVLGSNIANIGLIVSTAALLSNVKTEELMLRRDGYIMLFSVFLFLLFVVDFRISRFEAFIFLLLYFVYILFLLDKVKKHDEDIYFKDFITYFITFEYISDLKTLFKTGVREKTDENSINVAIKEGYEVTEGKDEKRGKKGEDILSENKTLSGIKDGHEAEIVYETESLSESSFLKEFTKLIASGIAIIIGAKYFIDKSIFFALLLEVPETIIGISLVAVGTSLPELMVTVSAARNGYASIALGNVIGSNITNTLLILGCTGLVQPLMVTGTAVYYITPFMLVFSLLLLLFIRTGWRIKRHEGLILFLLYSGFMVFIFRLG
ncbi:MAG: calcium/sodium antiporter [Methanosarcina mazei]|uniref:calcium/sodium antiporter n=1 Tax=Methanosarcina mazei TaxID=2209 RepID=UPI00064FFFEB|nr:calcium/sodium antiporter [Methanosarcina mazei]